MNTYPTLDYSTLEAGFEGPRIPQSQIVYFAERWRWRLFEFILDRFEKAEANGLTQAKLARRTGKSKEVINRWLSGPSNLTSDSIAILLLGICEEEPTIDGTSLFNRVASNHSYAVDLAETIEAREPKADTSKGVFFFKSPELSATTSGG
jgi:transcriptional regulator with XRE-family HTH domain